MWRKAHGADVVSAAGKCFCRSLQDLQSGPETVIWTRGRGEGRKRQGDKDDEYSVNITWRVRCWSGKTNKHDFTYYAITNVHHRKPCVPAQVAFKTPALHSPMEDLDSVVCERPATRHQVSVNVFVSFKKCLCADTIKASRPPRFQSLC